MIPSNKVAAEKLLNVVDAFREFKERVQEAFRAAFDWPEHSEAETPSQEAQTCSNVVILSS